MGNDLAQPSTELFHLPHHKTGKIIKEKNMGFFFFFFFSLSSSMLTPEFSHCGFITSYFLTLSQKEFESLKCYTSAARVEIRTLSLPRGDFFEDIRSG